MIGRAGYASCDGFFDAGGRIRGYVLRLHGCFLVQHCEIREQKPSLSDKSHLQACISYQDQGVGNI